MRRSALIVAGWLAGVAPAAAQAPSAGPGTMPPFLIGHWKIGALVPFTDDQHMVPLQRLEPMVKGKTLYITRATIALDRPFVARPGKPGLKTSAELTPFARVGRIDRERLQGTRPPESDTIVASVSVTPGDCPQDAIFQRSDDGTCPVLTFFSPDGFAHSIYLWLPGAIALLHKLPDR